MKLPETFKGGFRSPVGAISSGIEARLIFPCLQSSLISYHCPFFCLDSMSPIPIALLLIQTLEVWIWVLILCIIQPLIESPIWPWEPVWAGKYPTSLNLCFPTVENTSITGLLWGLTDMCINKPGTLLAYFHFPPYYFIQYLTLIIVRDN